jgi:hypothetical protein
MFGKALTRLSLVLAGLSLLLVLEWPSEVTAQRRGQGDAGRANPAGQGRGGTGQADAPFDLTGYWVAMISDEWRYRMLTPPKGNVDYVPVNAEGRRLAEQWDPARDEAAGEACKGYGAGGIMRLPSRLHITWQDPNTLKLEIDTGTQTRVFHFGDSKAPSGEEPSWQGFSVAQWELRGGRAGSGQPRSGQLKIVTTHLRPGYIRKNGVPFSSSAMLTEHMVVLTDDDGLQYLAVTTNLEDPQYLNQPWVRTSQFRRQSDSAGWNPTACSAR